MTNVQLVAALTPLKAVLNSALANFTNAAFSVQETNFIIQFDTTAITLASKTTLAATIKTLQQNLDNLLNQNKNQIKSQVAAAFSLADELATVLLDNIMVAPGPVSLLQKLEDESLIAKNPDGSYKEVTSTNFPGHFNAYSLLHKLSLLVSKMKIETKDLEWFIVNYAAVNTINFTALPVAAAINPNDYNGWQNLHLFLNFKSKYPEPENASLEASSI